MDYGIHLNIEEKLPCLKNLRIHIYIYKQVSATRTYNVLFYFQKIPYNKTSIYTDIKAFQKPQGLTIYGQYRSYVRDIISLVVLVF